MGDLHRHFHLALEAAHMAIWDTNIVDGNLIEGSVSWSAQGATLLGMKAHALTHSFKEFLEFVHPDDRDHVVDVLQSGTCNQVSYSLEYRVLWPDGTIHWLAAKAQVFCDARNVPERILGIIWDITERMRNESQAAERQELAEVTLGSIGDGVITTDAQGKTQYLNRTAEQLTGWSNKLAHGVDISETLKLVDEVNGAALDNVALKCLRLKQAIGTSTHSQLVTREHRRIAVEDSAAPIWSRSGEIMGTVVVFRDVSHQRRLTQQLSWHATHDTLTGLINRREFEARIANALASSKESGHLHALLYMDLDQFKIINDTCGHGAGDVLLQLLSKLLQTQMRDSDILARLGGDELGVLLPHCPLDHALRIAEEIRDSVKNFRFVWEGHGVEPGVSIGLVQINDSSKSMTELLIDAAQACYLAKEHGRNRIHVYNASDLRLAQRHGEMLWVARLNEAFERHFFKLYAMPIVHLNAPAESHDEVLIRIQNNKGDLILPGAFIPAAERYDLMIPIDRWVIKAVCQHIKSLRDSLPVLGAFEVSHIRAPAQYSINLSGVSISDPALHDYITEQFVQYEIAPEQICFEITETAAIANLPAAQVFMGKLKKLGCRFSLDDFGSGLSSFAYLKALPVDFLKIDGVFVRDIATNRINRAMVKSINEVGHVMGILTVAEYVENEDILAVVRELGIDFAQGFAMGGTRPLMAGAA